MEIESKELNKLGKYTKELVNKAIYYLYTVKETETIKSKYILKTNKGIYYGLFSNGEIEFEDKEIPEGILVENVYFSDIDVPLIKVDVPTL